MKIGYLAFILCLITQVVAGQYISSISVPDPNIPINNDSTDISNQFANTISAAELKTHLTILASDAFEGRETGEKGNELAAEYIAKQFKFLDLPKVGLENSYYQDVAFNKTSWAKNELSINGTAYKHLWDYLSFATTNESMPEFSPEEVIFLGYGIDDEKYSDFKGNDLKGKVIMINEGEPLDKDSISYITGTKKVSDWSRNVWLKLEAAKKHNVKLVLVIENDLKDFLGRNRRFLVSPSLQLGDGSIDDIKYANHIYISSTMAKEIIGKKAKKIKKWRKKNRKKAKTCDIDIPTKIDIDFERDVYLLEGHNVMGYIEGTDKKDELIIVSGHYDHLGKRGNDIYNGADDNGSGTSTILEVAQALKMAKDAGYGPRRSVLCLLVTGEEKGLLGSEYYAENPVFPIGNTVANVNIDMVGRTDETYKDNPKYIYVIGSDRLSSDLHKINESVNQEYSQLTLDYKYNDENDPNRYYFRSDHYNFAKKGIPAIFFFSGVHEDYHRTTDTVDKIMFDKMETVGKHVFHLIWELSNREERIVVDGK